MLKRIVFGIMLTLLFGSVFTLGFKIQPVKASGTIYIRADGSIEGTTSIQTTDNVTYVFTANINYDYIIVERNNIIIDGKGYVLQGADAYNSTGIDLSGRTNVTVKKAQVQNFIYGILLHSSSDCSIFGNKVTITNCGIELGSSSNNTVSGNNVTANRQFGIRLDFSSNNTIFGNNVISNQDTGINVESSSGNTIFGNNVTANNYGVYFYFSSWNNITANCVANNQYGILFSYGASNNIFYHNNFMNNFRQVYWLILANAWDDGYPSGGNYWSDYTGTDLHSGQYQNETGYDWVGDSPYVIDQNNTDRYPLMNPFESGTQEIKVAYRNLLGFFNNLLANFNALNSSYQQHLQDYFLLQQNNTALQISQGDLQMRYNSLNASYILLESSYQTLNSYYNTLNASFSDYKTSTQDDLSYTKDLVYVLTAITVILIIAVAYLMVRKPKAKPVT